MATLLDFKTIQDPKQTRGASSFATFMIIGRKPKLPPPHPMALELLTELQRHASF